MSNLKRFTFVVVSVFVVVWSMGGVFANVAFAAPTAGDLIKATGSSAVYYFDGTKRYVFPNEVTYKSWYADFSKVVTISPTEMGNINLGGNIAVRPGTWLVKITSDPKVYAIEPGGKLRHIDSEARATKLYGALWYKKVVDVPDMVFANTYNYGTAVNSDVYPVGALVKYASATQVYYVDTGSVRRPIASEAAMTANGFQSSFVVTTDISMSEGSSITNQEAALSNVLNNASSTPISTGTGLSVALAAGNPAGGSLVSDTTVGGQSLAPVLKFTFTAGNDGDVKVTTLKFKKGGISTDSDINNAYLYDGNTRLAEMQSISSSIVTFSDTAGLFTIPSGSSKTVTLSMDVIKNASAGKTFTFSLESAAGVVAGAATVTGTFPITGNTFTVASVTDLGKLAVATVTDPGSATDAADARELWRFSLIATNQNLKVYYVRLTNVGSVNAADIKNLKLMDGGTQLGTTVAQLAEDRSVTFDLSSSPLSISSGLTKNLSVYGDIVTGASRTFRFSVQKTSDIMVLDANYNVYLTPNGNTTWSVVQAANTTTINTGSVAVTKSTDSPTGNIAASGTNVTFAKYDVKASGENFKINTLTYTCNGTSSHTLKNVKLYVDGIQVGANTTTATCDNTTTYPISLGNSFVAQAGVTHKVTLIGDVTGTLVDTDSVTFTLETASGNSQGLLSLTAKDVPAADKAANTLTVAAGALTGAKNVAVGSVSTVAGVTGKTIASFLLTAGAAEGIDLNSIVIKDGDGSVVGNNGTNGLGSAFNNIRIKAANNFVGNTIVNPSSTASTTQTFNFSPAVSIPVGQSVQIDVVADIISGATWTTGDSVNITTSTSGTGKSTSTTVSLAVAKLGQAITVSSAGNLTVSLDGSTPANQQVVMGSSDNVLGVWRFEANNNEDLSVAQIILGNASSSGAGGDVQNLKLYVDGSPVGTVPSYSVATNSGTATFGSTTGTLFSVPAGTYKLVTLKASVTGQTDATGALAVTPKITEPAAITGVSTDTVIARGTQSGTYAGTTATSNTAYSANSSYAYRTKLSAVINSGSPSGTGKTRMANDTIFKMDLSASTQYQVAFRAGAVNTMDATTDDFSGGVTTAGTWAVVSAGDDGSTLAADTSVKVAGTGSMLFTQGATTPVAANGMAYTFTAADLSSFNGMAFWIKASNATPNLTLTLTGAGAGSQTVNPTSTDWEFMVVPFSGATTPFTTLTAVTAISISSATAYTAADTVNIDSWYFYKDYIKANIAASANGVDETLVTLKDNDSATTFAEAYTDGSATAQTAYFIPTSDFNISGGGKRTVSIVTDSSVLLSAAANLSVNVQLGSSSSTVASGGDILWYDGKVSTTIPWVNSSPNPVQGGSLGY